jgi:hypothetical protein
MLFTNIISIPFIFFLIALRFEPTFCPLYSPSSCHILSCCVVTLSLQLVGCVWLSNVTSTSWRTAADMVHRAFVFTLGPLLYFNFLHDYYMPFMIITYQDFPGRAWCSGRAYRL